MKRVVIGMCGVMMFLSASLSAATYTSIIDGNFGDSGTWDCGCIPTASDDVVIATKVTSLVNRTINDVEILAGASLKINAAMTIAGNVDIEPTAELSNNATINIKGDYILDGEHSGSGLVRYTGGGDISGTGNWNNSKSVEFNGGFYNILVGTQLDFSSTPWAMKSGARIANFGEVTVSLVTGNGLNWLYNRAGATMTVTNRFKPGFHVKAEYADNTVIFERNGATFQNIVVADDGYYNLHLKGSGASSIKKPYDDLLVINELRIEDCTFDTKQGTSIFDVEIQGDWNNVSGVFRERSTEVTFSGTDCNIMSHAALETFNNLTVSGTLTLHGDIDIKGEIFNSSVLDLNGNNVEVRGDWNNVASYISNGGQVIFTGTSDSDIKGSTDFDDVVIDKTGASVTAVGDMNIWETLSMDNGTLNTNDNLTIASGASRTGRIGVVNAGTFNGDIRVQRYMNFPTNGWHLIGAPVQDFNIGQWQGDFITTGYGGSDWPAYWFCSVTKYDETVSGHKDEGLECVANTAEVIPQGEGRRAYIASGYNMLSAKGEAITGPFSWNLSYTNTGSFFDDGWNLISNPYASTIDWDNATDWTKSGIRNAIYVWVSEDESFSSYIGGIGTNGGSPYIPSSQAFWVQAFNASAGLAMNEQVKVDVDHTFRNNEVVEHFYLKMTDDAGKTDEVAIRFDENATEAFDGDFDAYDFLSTNGMNPSVGLTSSDGLDLSIYSFGDMDEAVMIPMNVHLGAGQTASFHIEGFDQFPAERCKIYDAEEDRYFRLREDATVDFEISSGDYTDRFFLVLDPQERDNAVRNSTLAQSESFDIWNSDGTLMIESLADETRVMDLDIYNAIGQRLLSVPSMSLQGLTTQGLPVGEGVMIIELSDRTSGEQHIQRIVR